MKIGVGVLTAPISLHVSPKGTLVVLDQRDKTNFAVVGFNSEGQKVAEVTLPPDVVNPREVVADGEGTLYVRCERSSLIWVSHPDGTFTSLDEKAGIAGIAVGSVNGVEALYLLGEGKSGVLRLALPQLTSEPIVLSQYPAAGGLSSLHVRSNGDIYAFSGAESLVYHYDKAGKFLEKIGGGGPHPPKTGVPTDFMMGTYDVTNSGDVYWTLGNYGPLDHLTADGTTGVAYKAQESEYVAWTGPIHTLTGFAVGGGFGYEIDLGTKRITGFPLSLVEPHSTASTTVDARIFGLSYDLSAVAPYKLFTTETAPMQVVFNEGNRHLHDLDWDYQVYDLDRHEVDHGTQTLHIEGSDAVTLTLNPVHLPRLGWYEYDSRLHSGPVTLVEQVHFLGRVDQDPALPIPAKETSGWDDLVTHKMIGMGLERFGGNLAALMADGPDLAKAKAMGIPYFMQITEAKDCTAENVTALLKAYPDLPMLEIVNEPNLAMGVDKYVALLTTCYQTAKKLDPNVKIMGPAQCGTDLGWFESFFKNGGGNFVDCISVHTYERHNSMDMAHWDWKFDQIHAIMTKYGCGDKPLYQTEHGYLGDYHGPILRHRWQARSLMLEYMDLVRHDVGLDHYMYFYDNEGGFANFSSFVVNNDRELYPAALMTRERAHFLNGKQFAGPVALTQPTNRMMLANLFRGPASDVVELINAGAFRPVAVQLTNAQGAHVFDAFGNESAAQLAQGNLNLQVGMYPTYVVLPAHSRVAAVCPTFGHDLAPTAKIAVTDAAGKDDPKAAEGIPHLTNGVMEFDFESEPLRVGMRASDGDIPLDLTLDLGGAHRINSAILYSSFADNDKCAPLDYTVQVRSGGQWKTVDTITTPPQDDILAVGGETKRVTWYESPWIFEHHFAPVQADAVRFHFTRTSNGAYASPEMNVAVSQAFGDLKAVAMPQHVDLREVQVFAAP